MATKTFSWVPLAEPSGEYRIRTHTAQFGDGYTQDAGDGINNESSNWPLNFEVDETKAKAIVAFFRDHGGFKPFKWTPPLATSSKLFVAKGYTVQPVFSKCKMYRISVTFEERFAS